MWEHRSDEVFSEERERAAADRRFFLLDTNADHLLTAEELLPVYADIHPTESRYARMQAEHMMDMVRVGVGGWVGGEGGWSAFASAARCCPSGTSPPPHLPAPAPSWPSYPRQAECKDDRLTQEQMLRVPHAFYSVTHAEEHSEL